MLRARDQQAVVRCHQATQLLGLFGQTLVGEIAVEERQRVVREPDHRDLAALRCRTLDGPAERHGIERLLPKAPGERQDLGFGLGHAFKPCRAAD